MSDKNFKVKNGIEVGGDSVFNVPTYVLTNQSYGTPSTHLITSTDGISWVQRSSSTFDSNYISRATFGNNYFVGTGNNGTYRSTDGISWQKTSTTVSLSIAYGNNIFVQSSPNKYWSTDGVTWTQTTVPGDGRVYYLNNKFIIGDLTSFGTYYSSTDSVTWTTTTMSNFSYLNAFAYGNGKYIALDTNGGTSQSYSSTDLITWTTTSMPYVLSSPNSIAYGNGVFVVPEQSFSTTVLVSTNGIVWSINTLPSSAASGISTNISFGNGYFYIVGDENGSTTTSYYVSTDGITWNTNTLPYLTTWNPVIYQNVPITVGTKDISYLANSTSNFQSQINLLAPKTNPVFTGSITMPADTKGYLNGTVNLNSQTFTLPKTIAFSYSPTLNVVNFVVSTDGTIWSLRTLPLNTSYTGFTTNGSVYVVSTQQNVYYSYDLSTWNTSNAYGGLGSIIYDGNKFVGTVSGTQYISTSTDGISWVMGTNLSSTFSTNNINISYANSLYLITNSTSSSTTASYSTDLITWTTTTMPAAGYWGGMKYANSKYLATPNYKTSSAGAGNLAISTNGITWTTATMPITGLWQGFDYGASKWLAVGNSNSTAGAVSTDGVTWTTVTLPTNTASWTRVAYNGAYFVLTGGLSTSIATTTAYSTDGISWTTGAFPIATTGNSLYNEIQYFSNTPTASLNSNLINSINVPNLTSGITVGSSQRFVSVGSTFASITDNAILLQNKQLTTSNPMYGNSVGPTTFYLNGNYINIVPLSSIAYTSTDLTTWTSTTITGYSGPNNIYPYNSYSNGYNLFVAKNTGSSSYLYITSNGINWSQALLPAAKTWVTTTQIPGGNYVALASSTTTAAYSTNGVYWTVTTLPASSGSLRYITYGAGRLIATQYNSSSTFFTSTNGITWTTVTAISVANGIAGLAYGNGKFVAVDSGGTQCITSTDGLTWSGPTAFTGVTFLGNSSTTAYQATLAINTQANIAFLNGKFVSNSAGNPSYTLYSTDGIYWSKITSADAAGGYTSVINVPSNSISKQDLVNIKNTKGNIQDQIDNMSPVVLSIANKTQTSAGNLTSKSLYSFGDISANRFIGINQLLRIPTLNSILNNIFSISSDGISWTTYTITSPQPTLNFGSMVFGKGKYIATDTVNSTTTALLSTDLITWTATTLPSSSIWKMSYGNGIFLATNSGSSAYSTDGLTWVAGTQAVPGSYISYVNGYFLSPSNGGTTALLTSTDGINWTTRTLPDTGFGQSMIYSSALSKYILLESSGYFTTSTDTVTWTATSQINAAITTAGKLAECNGKLIFTGNGNSTLVYSSTDAVTWTQITLPNIGSNTVGPAYFINNNYYITSYAGDMAWTSTDLITWTANIINGARGTTAQSMLYVNSGSTINSTQLNNLANINNYVAETIKVAATAATGTINYDLLTNGAIMYYTSNASGNWVLNLRGNSTTPLNGLLEVGQSITITFMVTNSSPAYYTTQFQIDGVNTSVKWLGGSAPSAGSTNAVDAYSYSIVKTANSTYSVFGSASKFA